MDNEIFDDSLAYLGVYLKNSVESKIFQKPEHLNSNALSNEFMEGLERLKNRLEVNDYDCKYKITLKVTATRRN
jgi:hypothetical protein